MTPHSLHFRSRARRAFSLTELLIGMIVMSVVAGMAYLVLNTGLVLYAKNFALNHTHREARQVFEKICTQIHDSASTPDLLDTNGETVSGTGPVAGVRLTLRNVSGWYILPSNVLATAITVPIQVLGAQQAPKRTDLVVIPNLGFQGEVLSVSGTGASTVVTLTTTAGNCLLRPLLSGNAITTAASPNQTRAFILNRIAYIAIGTNLRYYPTAMRVSVDGTNTFNSGDNYSAATNLLPSGVTNTPFSFTDSTMQFLNIDLRVESKVFRANTAQYVSSALFRTSIGCRSTGILR